MSTRALRIRTAVRLTAALVALSLIYYYFWFCYNVASNWVG